MQAAEKIEDAPSLLEAVRECADEANGDVALFGPIMRRRIESDDALREVFWSRVLVDLWNNQLQHQHRSRFWKGAEREAAGIEPMPKPVERRPDDVSGVVSHIRRNEATLYDFPLPPYGKKLGDATAIDLNDAIKEWSRQARGHIRSVRWMQAIKKTMGAAKTVRDAVELDVLRQLQVKVERELPMAEEE